MKHIDTEEYLNTVCQLLAEGKGLVPVPVSGSSMVPFVFPGDMVYLSRPEEPLKRGDVVLYTRPGGQYVLHRIARIRKDGGYVMLGDAQTRLEQLDPSCRIHARAERAQRRGRMVSPGSLCWRFFAGVWLWLRPVRHPLLEAVEWLRRLVKGKE